MKYDPEAYADVDLRLQDLSYELDSLQQEIDEILSGDPEAPDLTWACEQVSAAADALVAAIEAWIPSLVPTPRSLAEVLQTIAGWQPNEHTQRTAATAQKLLEQLSSTSYGVHTANAEEFPDVGEFFEDLRATLEDVKRALS
jgi:hypothetical protein